MWAAPSWGEMAQDEGAEAFHFGESPAKATGSRSRCRDIVRPAEAFLAEIVPRYFDAYQTA